MATSNITTLDNSTEEWRDIPGYESLYQVSNLGNLRSLHYGKVRPAKLTRLKNGYLTKSLNKKGCKPRTVYAHRMVMLSFVGECPPKHVVNHKNGIYTDNRLVNLEYCTESENLRHKYTRLGGRSFKSFPQSVLATENTPLIQPTAQDFGDGWRHIPGYEGLYLVNAKGQVISLWKDTPYIMKPSWRQGYHIANLYSKDGNHRTWLIHRLVMLAFVGSPPFEKAEVNHINGVRNDNRLENLEYVDSKANKQHAIKVLGRRYGNFKTHLRGAAQNGAKLTDDKVRQIRQLAAEGVLQRDIASMFDVEPSTIGYIVRRKTWRHVS